MKVKVKSLSCVRLYAHQAPPPMGFSRQGLHKHLILLRSSFLLSDFTHRCCSFRLLPFLVFPARPGALQLMAYSKTNHLGHQKPIEQMIPL